MGERKGSKQRNTNGRLMDMDNGGMTGSGGDGAGESNGEKGETTVTEQQ